MFKTVLQTLLFLLISLLFLTGCDDINVATNIQEGASLTKNDQTIIFETDHGDAKDVLDIDKRVLTVNGVDRTDNTVTENENTWNFGPLRVVYQPVAPQLLPEGNVSIILTIPSKDIYPTASDFYTKELHIFVDTLAPTIEALTPKNNTTITDPLTPWIFDIHDNINGSGLDESSVKITFTDTNTSHMLVFDANSNTYRYLPSVTEPFALGNIAFTVYAKDLNGNEASFAGTVNVVVPVLTSISLESNVTTINIGEKAELTVTGTYSDSSTKELDTNIEWIVTPLDSVEVNGTVLTAKKDGNVTVQAKVETIFSNTLNLSIPWVVNGHVLPPEPDPIVNNSTLLGIDSNNNGVRDDVERWIYQTYDHPIERGIFMQSARAYQKVIVDPSKAHETVKYSDDVLSCEFYWIYESNPKPFNKYKHFANRKELKKIQFNTLKRHMAYERYNAEFNGEVFGAPPASKEKCEFDENGVLRNYL